MPIIECACGTKGPVPDSYAGKRVKCPQCGARIEVPALAATPDAPRPRVSSAAAAGASGAYDIAPDSSVAQPPPGSPGGSRAGVSISASGNLRTLAPPAAPDTDLPPLPPTVPTISASQARRAQELAERRKRGYVRDMIHALFFIASLKGVAMFIALAFLAAAAELPIIWIGLACNGVLCAYYFNVVVEAAGGERGLPGFDQWEGIWDSIAVPGFKFLGVWLMMLAPAIIVGLTLPMTGASEETSWNAFITLAIAGGLLWPVAILVVALGDFWAILRVDMLIRTAIAAPLAYAVVLALLAGSVLLDLYAGDAIAEAMGLPTELEPAHSPYGMGLVVRMLAALVSLYTTLVTMQAIGLYYRHFSDRFPWSAG